MVRHIKCSRKLLNLKGKNKRSTCKWEWRRSLLRKPCWFKSKVTRCTLWERNARMPSKRTSERETLSMTRCYNDMPTSRRNLRTSRTLNALSTRSCLAGRCSLHRVHCLTARTKSSSSSPLRDLAQVLGHQGRLTIAMDQENNTNDLTYQSHKG